jgi:hypothetical protein
MPGPPGAGKGRIAAGVSLAFTAFGGCWAGNREDTPMAHARRPDALSTPPEDGAFAGRPEAGQDCISVGVEAAAWLPAFTAACRIATGEGPLAAGWLRPGDLVLTRDSGLQPVVWVGRCQVPAAVVARRPDLWPCLLYTSPSPRDRG